MDLSRKDVEAALGRAHDLGLISDIERVEITSLLDDDFPFSGALRFTDSVHAHVKVDSIEGLPHEELVASGFRAENAKASYIKYDTGAGVNLVFSATPVAEDDRIDGADTVTKPFLDHVGIDMRDEASDTRAAFDEIVDRAAQLGWREVTQQGPVHCCHSQVKAKHWTFPPEDWVGWRRPIEFAFGELVAFDDDMGSDLRPIDPGHPLAPSLAADRGDDGDDRDDRGGACAGDPPATGCCDDTATTAPSVPSAATSQS